MSNALDKASFWSLFVVIVFLPIFFVPFTSIPFEISKGLLVVAGLSVSVLCSILSRFTDGKITIPKSRILFTGLILVLVFAISSLHSAARGASVFGSMFDVGSFAFLFTAFVLMCMCAILIREPKSAKIILLGFIISSTLLFVFQILHVFYPSALSFGILVSKTDSVFGSWNALGLFGSFFSVLSLFIIEFFTIPRGAKQILGVFMVCALMLLLLINSYLAWALLGVFSLLIFVYKITFSFHQDQNGEVKKYFPYLPFILFMASILLFFSSQLMAGYLARELKLANVDASPNFQSTLSVARAVLHDHPMFGVGPNRFGVAWAKYKPSVINNGPFWNNYFDSGSGVIPTYATVTGYAGIAALSIFFMVLILNGFGALFSSIKSSTNWDRMCFFITSLFLFTGLFFYPAGSVLYLLAFAFLGIFVGLTASHEPARLVTIVFSNNPKKSFLFLFLLVGLMFGIIFLDYKYMERFISVPSLRIAVLRSGEANISVPAIEKAKSLYPNDLYYRTSAQIYLAKFIATGTKPTELTEDEKTVLQDTLNGALSSALSAVGLDPTNYLNYQALGSVYLTFGQFGVQETSIKAHDAFTQASVLNPLNPGIKLSLAQVAYLDGDFQAAEGYATEALTLKKDYVDGLVLMSQIKKSRGNTSQAVLFAQSALSYTQNALSAFPTDQVLIKQNQDLTAYLESLKTPLPPVTPSDLKETNKKQ